MQNEVNIRLGRKRGDYAERAHRNRVRQVALQLAKETGTFASDLAKSYLQVTSEEEAR